MAVHQQSLAHEVHNFVKNAHRLRGVLSETESMFKDINTCGNFDQEQTVVAEILAEERGELEHVLSDPPCFIILGQTCYAKASVVNEVFNQTVLPPIDDEDFDTKWRMARFKYGEQRTISRSIPGSYELVDNLTDNYHSWRTIPSQDLVLRDSEAREPVGTLPCLEVNLKHNVLKDDVQVILSPTNCSASLSEMVALYKEDVLPIVMYAIGADQLTEKDLEELKELHEAEPELPVFFVRVPPPLPLDLTDGPSRVNGVGPTNDYRNSNSKRNSKRNSAEYKIGLNLFQQLCDIGFLSMLPTSTEQVLQTLSSSTSSGSGEHVIMESELLENFDQFTPSLVQYTQRVLRQMLVAVAGVMNQIHGRCLKMIIMTAFDMQRDMMVTPRRLEFAREKECELYNSLMDIAMKKQDEIKTIIAETVQDMKEKLVAKAAEYDFIGVDISDSAEIRTARDLKICTGQVEELLLGALNNAIAGKLVESVDILRDSYTGTLTRCLESLEKADRDNNEHASTTEALKQIINAAYQVEITIRTSSSFVRILLEKMKQLIQSMPWKTPPRVDENWRKKMAQDMIKSLSEARLAKSICAQFKERLKNSHEQFSAALKQLEAKHSGRLEKTEEQRLKVRKIHAPKVAKLALESISMKDFISFGMPQLGREIGRGQYGVVYSCENWAGIHNCAIKSVVPPDEKHWNDLALEFFYTKNVPEHPRVAGLRGSVIDYSYGGGSSPAVYLIMDRMHRDLYAAIKTGLDWQSRLQVAIDVVEGMRFLHSQGLVHRDIKLKNVLMDKQNRGKITDLGFCKPEAMMSGSIVGTPIHMAPELFSGRYDNSVDVYAFGILFWYVCAGHVRLPFAFEQCTSKDQLWMSVKKGMRPEKLPHFDEECWELMQACWAGDQNKRPLLGDVEPQLKAILERFKISPAAHMAPNSKALHKLLSTNL
ncbi:dual serine/threonine and tyrosine protein kinase [Lingula anatina]|uniref:Dual serine/threonine and tyrosine protein kinase n=1 Tax=Lingula anatina TaxID=7574 RepID=A0A1S3JRL5_LINAN|nr:dual serine/threonine and tyrosine protein kinase [Lingula anatina]|eukprot:XP_013412982.1 dual serine/threonine and tyrosine protein kinase [Lingula anatina]